MTTPEDREDDVTLAELKKKVADFAKGKRLGSVSQSQESPTRTGRGSGRVVGDISMEGEVPRGLPDWKDEEKQHLGEELSDVLLYLVRLSDICGIDLGKAALRKLEINANKYPVKLCKGSSKNTIKL